MRQLCLNAGAIALIAFGHLTTPLIAEEANQALRSIAEKQTKEGFDQAVSKVREAAQKKTRMHFKKDTTTSSGL